MSGTSAAGAASGAGGGAARGGAAALLGMPGGQILLCTEIGAGVSRRRA